MIGWGKGFLTEAAKIVNVIPSKDQTGAAMTSLYTGLQNYRRITYIINTGALAAGMTDMSVTVEQATAAAGTGTKALAFDQGMVWKSLNQTQVAAGDAMVAATVTSNAFTITNTDDNSIYAVNLRNDMLDINNGFCYTCIKLSTPGANATLLGVTAILYDGWLSGKETTLPSVLG